MTRPSLITIFSKGKKIRVSKKTEDYKKFSNLFYKFLSYPYLKSDNGSTMNQNAYKKFLKEIKNHGVAVGFSYDIPVKLQYSLNGQVQNKTWVRPYWKGSPIFLIILTGRRKGRALLYDSGARDTAFILYYPVVNFKDFLVAVENSFKNEKNLN